MILFAYISRRFFIYFFLVNIALMLLYNFIEFFEKLTQMQNAYAPAIVHFIFLNLLPSFFDLIPLGGWIATFLLLRELYQKNELSSLNLLGISGVKMIPILFSCGLFISILSFVGKEIIIHPLSQMSEKFKMEQLKRNTYKRLYNQWFLPQDNLFAYFQLLDIEENQGKGFSLLFMNEDFQVEKRLEAKEVRLLPEKQELLIPKGINWLPSSNESYMENYKSLHLPGLFAHLKMYKGAPSLKRQIYNLILIYNLLPYATFNQEFGKFLSRLLRHLQPLIYVLLTFCLFFAAPYAPYYRWSLIFLTYPIFLIITSIADFLLQHDAPFWITFIPYFIAILIFAICRLTFMKN